MGIGLGIILIVAGAVLLWALDLDLEFLDDDALGLILLGAGLLALILALVMNAQRSRTKHTVEERRYGDRY
ncbi:MAG TPA: DUF6458 family protein [Nocardioidaceae bacterium]|jgi:hypothetical protein|nr:DUF6458 family protein [Nocardioidaceae bacterium]